MNITHFKFSKMAVAIMTTLALAACASSPPTPSGAVTARTNLTSLQANSELASRARIEIQDAELAVIAAEQPENDSLRSTHLVLLANRQVEIATLWAQSRLYEDQRAALSQASDEARLDARTRETANARRETQNAQQLATQANASAANARDAADVARDDANTARSSAVIARSDASSARSAANVARDDATNARDEAAIARSQADSARRDATAAQLETESLERQILELNARNTDRGLVVTLGDVLFASGNAMIVGSNDNNLEKLAEFLNRYSTRLVTIEGHTDSVGDDNSNMGLSQRRADAVRDYLIGQGVAASRLSASGKGENSPVSGNDTDTGRQQNRRVEVIIANDPSIVSTR